MKMKKFRVLAAIGVSFGAIILFYSCLLKDGVEAQTFKQQFVSQFDSTEDNVTSPSAFPATVITSASSTSPFATTQNAFWETNSSLAGQCTWYAYGRTIELAASGQLDPSAKTLMENAFWGRSGRDAQNWPALLGGEWTYTGSVALPLDKRKPGMLVVWEGGSHGHVAFVEEVSADLTQYRVSDFNFIANLTYSGNRWYSYTGSPSDCFTTLGCPYFYQLPVLSAASCNGVTSTLLNRDGGPPIHPPGSVIKTAANPTVYLIDSEGRKRPITSAGVLAQLYNQSTDSRTSTNFVTWVITVSQSELDLYEQGGNLSAASAGNGMPFPDGKLIGLNGQVSIVTGGGKRRPFASANTFTGLGFQFCQVVNVSTSEYNSYPVGAPVDAMLLLTSSVNLSPSGPYSIGQNINGSFTIKNVGYSSVPLSSLVVGGYLNGVCCSDMNSGSPTLNPGDSYPYSGSRALGSAGTWNFFAAFLESNGRWTSYLPASPGVIRSREVTASNTTPISVTIATNPSGLSFTVDNNIYVGPNTFSWIAGQSHVINVITPQGDSQTRRIFNGWSDGNSQNPRTVAPNSAATYTANFTTQYFLTTNTNPSIGGVVSPSSGWYNAGQNPLMLATPGNGYTLNGWTGSGNGSYSGTNNPANITMNGPISESANFTQSPTPTPTPTPTATPTPIPTPTPANNNFANAQVITGISGTVSGTNVAATKEAGEPNHAGNVGGTSVWYRWQSPNSGTATITTTGSNFDTLLGVYSGSNVSSLATIASNDDDPNGGLQSRVVFVAVSGTVYYIAVDGFNGVTGSIVLNWNLSSPTPTPTARAISGTVTFGVTAQGIKPMSNVTLSAVGDPQVMTTTNAMGFYQLMGLGSGAYTVNPTKTGDVNGISGFDAALIAQHVAGLTTLSLNQQSAADASNNGSVSGFDAALTAQYSAGIPNVSSVAGTWKFLPPNRSYPSNQTDQTNQDYEAVLVGDVSGNWIQPSVFVQQESIFDLLMKNLGTDGYVGGVRVSLANEIQPFTEGEKVTVPIMVEELSGRNFLSYDFEIAFDPDLLEPNPENVVVATQTLSEQMNIVTNSSQAGKLRVTAFGTRALEGNGVLLLLQFRIKDRSKSASPVLEFKTFQFNEEIYPVVKRKDRFIIRLSN